MIQDYFEELDPLFQEIDYHLDINSNFETGDQTIQFWGESLNNLTDFILALDFDSYIEISAMAEDEIEDI